MSGWRLDTNVISELRRPRPEPKVVTFVSGKPLHLLFVSSVTLAELRFGIESVADLGKRTELHDWLTLKVRPMFDRRVLPVSEDLIVKWRILVEEGRKVRRTFSQPDLFIAATALHHGLIIVSRNVGDFQAARAAVVNPWEGA